MKQHTVARLTEISVKMMRFCLPFFILSLIVHVICASHEGAALALLISKCGVWVFGAGCVPMIILILIFGVGWFIEN